MLVLTVKPFGDVGGGSAMKDGRDMVEGREGRGDVTLEFMLAVRPIGNDRTATGGSLSSVRGRDEGPSGLGVARAGDEAESREFDESIDRAGPVSGAVGEPIRGVQSTARDATGRSDGAKGGEANKCDRSGGRG